MSPLTEPTKLTLAKGQPVPVDLNYSNVSLLLHGNGTNGSTTIVDNSPTPKTVTAAGDAKISTAQSKFGGSSIAFDGSGDNLQSLTPLNPQLNLSTGDFTVEAWVYLSAAPVNTANNNSSMMGWGTLSDTTEAWSFGPLNNRTVRFYWFIGGGNSVTSSTLVNLSEWVHLAATRSGNTLRIFINGVDSGSESITGIVDISQSPLLFGRVTLNGGFNGYIDDLRITKGVARYTSNFTHPPHLFRTSSHDTQRNRCHF